jgi:hypothetical protein
MLMRALVRVWVQVRVLGRLCVLGRMLVRVYLFIPVLVLLLGSWWELV